MPSPLPIPRRQSLEHHLRFNHYPPIHLSFVETAEAAIEAVERSWAHHEVVDQQTLDTPITLPTGKVLTVQEVMDQLHLWDYIEQAGV